MRKSPQKQRKNKRNKDSIAPTSRWHDYSMATQGKALKHCPCHSASNRRALACHNERAEKHKVYNLQSLIPSHTDSYRTSPATSSSNVIYCIPQQRRYVPTRPGNTQVQRLQNTHQASTPASPMLQKSKFNRCIAAFVLRPAAIACKNNRNNIHPLSV